MRSEPSQVAILFADISGSCEMFQRLGNDVARRTMGGCLDAMSQVVENFGGAIIKTIGDEIMCSFPAADAAAKAACSLQIKVESYSRERSPEPLSVRIGFYFGEVLHENGDIFGDSVNVAARLAAYAKAKQIITCRDTLELCSGFTNSRRLDRVRLKGRDEKVEIFELFWKEDISVTVAASLRMSDDDHNLILQFGSNTLNCNEENFKVSIGRDPNCDIRVNGVNASRKHATVEYRRGAFVLTDISTNATYFRQGSEETRLHREAMPILAGGQLSLGVPFRKNPEEIIELYEGQDLTASPGSPRV